MPRITITWTGVEGDESPNWKHAGNWSRPNSVRGRPRVSDSVKFANPANEADSTGGPDELVKPDDSTPLDTK